MFCDFDKNSPLLEKLIHVSRVTKVVKGGRIFSFSALVVVGDRNGKVGLGFGKAREVPDAQKKAVKQAKKSVILVPLNKNKSIFHDFNVKYKSASIMLKSAPAGTGIKADPVTRAICECLGIENIVGKSHGSSRPHVVSKAVLKLFSSTKNPKIFFSRKS